jgi:ferredoxin--NADP+ reductase
MFEILNQQHLTPNTDLMIIKAPEIARKAFPGQFVLLQKNEHSVRIPLPIADFDRVNGTVSVIFQKPDISTSELGDLNSGDALVDFTGPLGKAMEIRIYGRVVLVASGAGIGSVYPIARALYEANNYVTVILGARSADQIFWEEKINAVCDEFYLYTEDGSKGRKGWVTAMLREQLEACWTTAQVCAIGPLAMMKSCFELAQSYQVPIFTTPDLNGAVAPVYVAPARPKFTAKRGLPVLAG